MTVDGGAGTGVGGPLRALVRPVWRALPWRVLVAAAGVGLLPAALTRLPGNAPNEQLGYWLLRLTALLGALGLAFLLDDPGRHTTGTAPVGRAARATLRMALAFPALAVWWTAAVLLIPAASRPPVGPVTLEAAAMTACALALATTALRFTTASTPGAATARTLGAVALAVVLVPERWGLVSLPGEPWWGATQVRWTVALTVAVGLCAAWTPEPLRRRRARIFSVSDQLSDPV